MSGHPDGGCALLSLLWLRICVVYLECCLLFVQAGCGTKYIVHSVSGPGIRTKNGKHIVEHEKSACPSDWALRPRTYPHVCRIIILHTKTYSSISQTINYENTGRVCI